MPMSKLLRRLLKNYATSAREFLRGGVWRFRWRFFLPLIRHCHVDADGYVEATMVKLS
jgi:hypothetical protein